MKINIITHHLKASKGFPPSDQFSEMFHLLLSFCLRTLVYGRCFPQVVTLYHCRSRVSKAVSQVFELCRLRGIATRSLAARGQCHSRLSELPVPPRHGPASGEAGRLHDQGVLSRGETRRVSYSVYRRQTDSRWPEDEKIHLPSFLNSD